MFSVKDQRVTFLPSWATWCLLQTPSSAFWHDISQAKYINGKTDRSLSDGSIRVLLFLGLWVRWRGPGLGCCVDPSTWVEPTFLGGSGKDFSFSWPRQ